MARISNPCRSGDLCTSRPLPTPRMNKPVSAAAMEMLMAGPPSKKKCGRMGMIAAKMNAMPMVRASYTGLLVSSGLMPSSFSTRVRSHSSLSCAISSARCRASW